MTTKKQKLSDVAKTLQMNPNDLIALFSEPQDGTEKKSSSTLTEAEVNLVLESITQHQQVTDGFAAYFATKNSTREEVAQQSMKKGNEKNAAHQQQNQGKKQPRIGEDHSSRMPLEITMPTITMATAIPITAIPLQRSRSRLHPIRRISRRLPLSQKSR